MSESEFDPPRNSLNSTSSRFKPRATTLSCPKPYLKSHPTLAHLFETLVSRPFRNEIEALGGYDTSETGKSMRCVSADYSSQIHNTVHELRCGTRGESMVEEKLVVRLADCACSSL